MKYNILDYIEDIQNLSTFKPDELVFMCKRVNNPKRDFLFVNKYQAKHIPIAPKDSLRLYDEFFEEILKKVENYHKILVVGFAETATCLAGYVSYKLDKLSKLSAHTQTTRENLKTKKLFDFLEEHSHAMEQSIYIEKDIPNYDYVLFVEDEITTGNTILNFKSQFDEINSAKYGVASILNWQNDENIEKFEDIDRIFLMSGKLKNKLDVMQVQQSLETEICKLNPFEIIKTKAVMKDLKSSICENFYKSVDNQVMQIVEILKENINENDQIEFIGTEEFMFIPFMVSNLIENNSTIRATTRSPITTSKDCIINSFVSLKSAYDSDRKTFLYNIENKPTKMIVITDANCNEEFLKGMQGLAFSKKCELLIVEVYYNEFSKNEL